MRAWITATSTSGTAQPRPVAEVAGTGSPSFLLGVSGVATLFLLTLMSTATAGAGRYTRTAMPGGSGQAWEIARSKSTAASHDAAFLNDAADARLAAEADAGMTPIC
jgi:hypothetical protein